MKLKAKEIEKKNGKYVKNFLEQSRQESIEKSIKSVYEGDNNNKKDDEKINSSHSSKSYESI